MTRRRDTELRDRLQALRVNEPLKLKKEGLTFKAPPGEKEVPQTEAPPIQHSHFESPQSELPQPEPSKTLVQRTFSGEAPQPKDALIAIAQNEVAHPKLPQFEAGQKEVVTTSHGEAPRNNPPQNEVPQREVAGFFKLSHRVFFEPLLRDLTGDSFRLFLWLSSRAWRYPSSDGTVRASVGYIESQAGMSHATISRALKILKEKALVCILEVDFKKGNLWQVSSIACSHPSPDTDPEDKLTHKKGPQNEAPRLLDHGASKRASPQLNLRQPPPQNEGDLRSIKKEKNKKEVGAAGKICPVIFAKLDDAEPDPIPAEEAIATFEAQLPSDQQARIISGFVERQFPHGFFPPERVVKIMAVKDWWRNQARPSVNYASA